MLHVFKKAWTAMVHPMIQRPKRLQVAALCYRETPEGRQVLLVTSRDTGRWIVPKGWPIDGLDGPGAALQEAWEEAGVRHADIESEPLGLYEYDKGLGKGLTMPVETQVYLTRVRHLCDAYPEAGQRQRKWVSPARAAELVDEPDLKLILTSL
tara:strand:+ start:178 stop:636 length:459 start_codon:yes stop_codon:yes gene_type:complete